MPKIEPGDIVLCYRKQYRGPFRYLITRAILFFTTAWWRHEPTSKVYHAELAVENISDTEFRVVTMEPPECRYKDRSYRRKVIFRATFLKPDFIKTSLDRYLAVSLGKKYDYFRLILMVLNWVFRTSWFTDHYKNGEADICSEFDARFYAKWLNYPCSTWWPDSTTPDDIYDFCKAHPELFKVVYDDRG